MIAKVLIGIVVASFALFISAVVYLETRAEGYCLTDSLCTAKAWARKEGRQ